MKLLKPPILEAYIRFDFTFPETAKPLDFPQAREFLELFKDKVKPKDFRVTDDVKIDWNKAGKPEGARIQRAFDTARGASADESRWIQMGQRFVATNILRQSNHPDYPGFDVLKQSALECFDAYVTLFSPIDVSIVTLHYVDVIEIPKITGLKLSEYMKLLPQVPDQGFGSISQFMIALTLPSNDKADVYNVIIGREPDDPARKLMRLRIEWDAQSQNVKSLSKVELIDRLDRIHAETLRLFRSCFTDAGWNLFEPMAEEKG